MNIGRFEFFDHTTSTAQACGAHVASNAASVQPLYEQIKLALDVHAGDLMVVRMVDGAKPQPPQKRTIAGFLEWVASKQRESNHWWKPERWEELKLKLDGWLIERREVFRPLILAMDQAVRELS